jgi:hypothetical protein
VKIVRGEPWHLPAAVRMRGLVALEATGEKAIVTAGFTARTRGRAGMSLPWAG